MSIAERGTVYLVGAGPGDPELLTVRASKLIAAGTYILHDDLVSEEILSLASPSAVVCNVGKRCGVKAITQEEINDRMILLSQEGHSVIRLKSGDPMLFGRAGEEMDALFAASIPFEVVPGISAAFAAAATLKISLTDRRARSKVLFLSGHKATGPAEINELPSDAAIAMYMPGKDYARIAEELMRSGILPDTPCLLVSHAGKQSRQSKMTCVGEMGAMEPLPAPAILLVCPVKELPLDSEGEFLRSSVLIGNR